MKYYYSTLIKHGDGVMSRLMTQEFVDLIKQYNGAAVLSGYDQTKYIAMLVFEFKEDRDEFSGEIGRRGFAYDERNDVMIVNRGENE